VDRLREGLKSSIKDAVDASTLSQGSGKARGAHKIYHGKSKLYDPQIGVGGVSADTTRLGYR
jgi:hypothetical protein